VALATQVAYATMTSNSTKANHAGLAETLLPATTEHLFPTTVVSCKLIFQTFSFALGLVVEFFIQLSSLSLGDNFLSDYLARDTELTWWFVASDP
jgi:hypothetical protein